MSTFLKKILNQKVPISPHYNPKEDWLNFNNAIGEGQDLEHCQWYITPSIISYDQLSNTSFGNLREIMPLFPLFQSFLSDNMDVNGGIYNNIYYGFNKDRFFFQFPAHKTSVFYDWKRTEDKWKYFASGKMDFYDIRWRPFYREALQKKYSPILYGPYSNPSSTNQFFALTLSQTIQNKGEVHGTLNHDINLNFKGKYDKFFGINNNYMHYFITGFDGKIFSHSKVTIMNDTDSLTMVEFSQE